MVSTAVNASAVARVVGVQTRFRELRTSAASALPQRIAVVGQGSATATYSTTPTTVFTAKEVADVYGFGSPLHLAAKELFPVNGDGVGSVPVTLYPVQAAGGAATAAGNITPSGSQNNASTYQVRISGVLSETVTLAAGATAGEAATALIAAINAVLDMPVIASDNLGVVELDAKWAGESGNDITVEILGVPDGIAFAITQPTGGATNPDVDTALSNINSVWETIVINTLNTDDTTTLDKFKTWGDGRINPLVNKTAVVLGGSTDTLANLVVLGDARKETDRVNCIVPIEGSPNLPLQIAARAASRIAVLADTNAAQDYAGLPLTGIIPGTEAQRWDYAKRDQAVKAGISTVEIVDGTPELSDTVTFYHPVGEVPPAYRYVVDIMKIANIQYNVQLAFANNEWKGAPLIADGDVTLNPTAKRPKDAVTALNSVIRGAGLQAWIADVAFALGTVVAAIDTGNPKRLNAAFTVKLSGNTNIISVDLNFGFFFGS